MYITRSLENIIQKSSQSFKVIKPKKAVVFFLTGSQQYHLMQGVSESLAGRVAILELAGLSLRKLSYSNAGKDYRFAISYYCGKDKIRKKKDGEETAKEAEIDLIIEENGILYPIEIKLSANPKLSMTNAFDVLDKIPQKKRGIGAIICLYDHMLWLKENIVALPIEYI